MGEDAHISETVSAGQLRAFIERIERVEEDIKALNADKSEIYKELRGCGFDVKAVRQCVAARKLDSAEREERTAIFELYWAALTGPSRVHVHEGQSYAEAKVRPADQIAEGLKEALAVAKGEAEPYRVHVRGELTDTQEQPERASNSASHTSAVHGGEPSIPSSNANVGKRAAVEAGFPCVQLEQAATVSHSPAPATSSQAQQADTADDVPPPASSVAPFEPPAFLTKPKSSLRPLCQNPENCAGYGSHTCHSCLKASETEAA